VGIFQDRVTFDLVERRLYSHDVGVFPQLVRPVVGNTLPAAVVRPHSEAELVGLARLANAEKIPLVPRGMATSGYGGVLPTKGGLVVDFVGMHGVLGIDIDELMVTVEPGVIWGQLEHELAKHNLALCLYPSSARSSTVGGWLAQGGGGYGSFEYGWFREAVVSARVVLPSGEAREFAGDELELISDAEGITGFISQVTLRVRGLEDEEVVGARFSSPASLAAALEEIAGQGIPLWSVTEVHPISWTLLTSRNCDVTAMAADSLRIRSVPDTRWSNVFVCCCSTRSFLPRRLEVLPASGHREAGRGSPS